MYFARSSTTETAIRRWNHNHEVDELHEATNPSSALRRRLRRQRLACVCSAVSAEGLLWCPSSDASVRGAGRNTTNGCDSHPASQLRLHRYCLRRSGGLTYSGTRIGRDPHNRGKTTTTIPTQLIPLIITINDGTTTHTYDPPLRIRVPPGRRTLISSQIRRSLRTTPGR